MSYCINPTVSISSDPSGSKKAKKDNLTYSGKLCHEYIDEIIDACKKEQKK